jgi:hypothetical protein
MYKSRRAFVTAMLKIMQTGNMDDAMYSDLKDLNLTWLHAWRNDPSNKVYRDHMVHHYEEGEHKLDLGGHMHNMMYNFVRAMLKPEERRTFEAVGSAEFLYHVDMIKD